LGHRASEALEALKALPEGAFKAAINREYAKTDMLQSLRIGLSFIPRRGAFYVLPADMPAVSKEAFQALAKALEESGALFARPVCCGRRGHPLLLSSKTISLIESFKGNGGLRQILIGLTGVEVEVSDKGCLQDADTPEDYLALLELERSKAHP
jgi:CTP:molybdopterin cytidylyltransferase MocA